MQFAAWYERLKIECARRLGLDFESDFGRDRAEWLFALGDSPRAAIDWLIEKYDLDDLAEFPFKPLL